MNDALIGYSGFVGSNILSKHNFKNLYDINNISKIDRMEFDLIVCAAAPGIKWRANKYPKKDLENIHYLIKNLIKVKTKKIVLISTIDVYHKVDKVDEDSIIDKNMLNPYGLHRRILEEFVQKHFDSTTIRLPGVFGNGLKGNIIYDFLNKRFDFIPKEGFFQFYYLKHLWKDISKALNNNLKILNISTEPISISELSMKIFNIKSSKKWITNKKPYYDMHTKYGHLWGKEDSYLYSKSEILSEIKDFVDRYLKKY